MAQFRRLTTIVAAVLLAAVALAAALALARAPAAGALPALTVTPTTTPIFSATLSLIPDRQTLLVGETLTMTADLTVGEGCIYPIFELQPVSYTHLDVYKRQSLKNATKVADYEPQNPCVTA